MKERKGMLEAVVLWIFGVVLCLVGILCSIEGLYFERVTRVLLGLAAGACSNVGMIFYVKQVDLEWFGGKKRWSCFAKR